MRNYEVWADDGFTNHNSEINPIAIRNKKETIKLIKKIGGLNGKVLDVGTRNAFTEELEKEFGIQIDSSWDDLDLGLKCPDKKYDFVHYNNVIEHQFNPLRTLLDIKEVLKEDGRIILGMPLKPKFITTNRCHFHEFDQRAYALILERAELKEIERVHFLKIYSIKGLRAILGSFHKRKVLSILVKG